MANGQRSFIQTFADDSGFVYDNSKNEFVDGELLQKSLALSASLFTASYYNSIDGNYGNGVLSGSPVGGASIVDNKLDLKGGAVKYVDYSAVGNADSQQQGALRFMLTPNYSGDPLGTRAFVIISRDDNDRRNHIAIFHKTNGQLAIQIRDKDDNNIINSELGIWNPSEGEELEVELNWNVDTGEHRLFLMGSQFGSTQSGIGERDSNINLLRVGGTYTGAAASDFEISNLVIFSEVQHTLDYTPGYVISETEYGESIVELPEFEYDEHQAILSYEDLVTEEENSPQQIWNGLYHDTASWVVSNGTFQQSNTKLEILSNLDSFPFSDKLNVIMTFNSQNVKMSISYLEIVYQVVSEDLINKCTVYWYSRNTDNTICLSNYRVSLVPSIVKCLEKTSICDNYITVTPNPVDGYVQVDLIPSDFLSKQGYLGKMVYLVEKQRLNGGWTEVCLIEVLNVESSDLWSLQI